MTALPRPNLSSHLIIRCHEELDSDRHDPIMPAHSTGMLHSASQIETGLEGMPR